MGEAVPNRTCYEPNLMYTYPPKFDFQCECGNVAAKKVFSPITKKNICRPCAKRYERSHEAQLNYLSKLEQQYQKELEAKKEKNRQKSREKYHRKKQGLINPCGGYEFDTPEFREKQKTLPARQKYLRENPTPAEVHIKTLFEQAPYDVTFQKGFIAYDYYCIVDFYLPFYKVCLEIDGGYHLEPDQVEKDKRKDKYLTETRHCLVKRLTNEEAFAIKTFEQLNDFLELSEIELLYPKYHYY